MVLFVCPVVACPLKLKGHKKLSEHWRKTHERHITLYTCTKCKKTFSLSTKAAAHLRQAGSQHWSREIQVTNRNYMDPGRTRFNEHTKELSPREVAAQERRLKAVTPGAEVLYHSTGDSVNRDEEVIMLEDGRFMRQRKVSERKRHLLLSPAEPTILDYNDDPPEL